MFFPFSANTFLRKLFFLSSCNFWRYEKIVH